MIKKLDYKAQKYVSLFIVLILIKIFLFSEYRLHIYTYFSTYLLILTVLTFLLNKIYKKNILEKLCYYRENTLYFTLNTLLILISLFSLFIGLVYSEDNILFILIIIFSVGVAIQLVIIFMNLSQKNNIYILFNLSVSIILSIFIFFSLIILYVLYIYFVFVFLITFVFYVYLLATFFYLPLK